MKPGEFVRACDRDNNETVTLIKHVNKYKYMRKWMIELLSKYESRDINIARVNSIDWRHQIYQITLNFYVPLPLGDVIKRTRFLRSSPVNFALRMNVMLVQLYSYVLYTSVFRMSKCLISGVH